MSNFPKVAKFLSHKKDLNTGIECSRILFEKRNDYCGFEGPETEEFYEGFGGGYTSLNLCNKPYQGLFKETPEGLYKSELRPAWTLSQYTEKQVYGPFYIVAEEADTKYFCIRHEDGLVELEHQRLDFKAGEKINFNGKSGWTLCVLLGVLSNLEEGAVASIQTNSISLTAKTKGKAVLVRRKQE